MDNIFGEALGRILSGDGVFGGVGALAKLKFLVFLGVPPPFWGLGQVKMCESWTCLGLKWQPDMFPS